MHLSLYQNLFCIKSKLCRPIWAFRHLFCTTGRTSSLSWVLKVMFRPSWPSQYRTYSCNGGKIYLKSNALVRVNSSLLHLTPNFLNIR